MLSPVRGFSFVGFAQRSHAAIFARRQLGFTLRSHSMCFVLLLGMVVLCFLKQYAGVLELGQLKQQASGSSVQHHDDHQSLMSLDRSCGNKALPCHLTL